MPFPCPPPFSELQEKAAELLGVERTLFVPTNTMANLISGECLTRPSEPQLKGSVALVGTHLDFFWVQLVEHSAFGSGRSEV